MKENRSHDQQLDYDRSMGGFFKSEDPTPVSASPPPFNLIASNTSNPPNQGSDPSKNSKQSEEHTLASDIGQIRFQNDPAKHQYNNLNDVAWVQERLLELGFLSPESYQAEYVKGETKKENELPGNNQEIQDSGKQIETPQNQASEQNPLGENSPQGKDESQSHYLVPNPENENASFSPTAIPATIHAIEHFQKTVVRSVHQYNVLSDGRVDKDGKTYHHLLKATPESVEEALKTYPQFLEDLRAKKQATQQAANTSEKMQPESPGFQKEKPCPEENEIKEKEPELTWEDVKKLLHSGFVDARLLGNIGYQFAKTRPQWVFLMLDNLPAKQRDNIAFQIAARSSDTDLASYPKPLLGRLSSELKGIFNTGSWSANRYMALRLQPFIEGKDPSASPDAENQAENLLPQERGLQFQQELISEEWEGKVSQEGDVLTATLPDGKEKVFSLSALRTSISNSWNWSGIVKLMKAIAATSPAFEYSSPTDLKGNETDNARIMPDALITHLVYLQIENGTVVDGDPGPNTLSALFGFSGTKAEFMDQREEAEGDKLPLDEQVLDEAFVQSNPADVYEALREIVLARNGLWSDEEQVTNVVAIRNWGEDIQYTDENGQALATPQDTEGSSWMYHSGYKVKRRLRANDHFFVLWKENGEMKATVTMGSTDPGEPLSDNRIAADQTLTSIRSWHSQFEPSARNLNHLYSGPNPYPQGSVTFKDDAKMNFHLATHKNEPPSMSGKLSGNYISSQKDLDIYLGI